MKEAHLAKGHGKIQAYSFFFPNERYRPAIFKIENRLYFKGKFPKFHRNVGSDGFVVDDEKNRLAVIGAH